MIYFLAKHNLQYLSSKTIKIRNAYHNHLEKQVKIDRDIKQGSCGHLRNNKEMKASSREIRVSNENTLVYSCIVPNLLCILDHLLEFYYTLYSISYKIKSFWTWIWHGLHMISRIGTQSVDMFLSNQGIRSLIIIHVQNGWWKLKKIK